MAYFELRVENGSSNPLPNDLNKMHVYRDTLRAADGRRFVSYAAIMYPGQDIDFSGTVGAISGVSGYTSPTDQVHAIAPALIILRPAIACARQERRLRGWG